MLIGRSTRAVSGRSSLGQGSCDGGLPFWPHQSECVVRGRRVAAADPMAGRLYQRGPIYYIAYRRDGREVRESTRSTDLAQAAQLLEQRLAEAAHAPGGPVLFDTLATRYLEEYVLHEFRSANTAAGRVAHLHAVFGGQPVTAITTDAIRAYQRQRRTAGAAAATVNRETSALSRMLRLGIEAGQVTTRPLFPARLREHGPRQGFFEHGEYLAVRAHLPPPYQDVLDFAYYSGWRRREITDLRWDEVDRAGGVVRLSPARSKTRTGRVLPLSAPLRAVLDRR